MLWKIVARMLMHENLGEAHRKHAYLLMPNELHLSHPLVSSIYMSLQLAISLGFVYLCPVLSAGGKLTLETWHWIYLAFSLIVLSLAYVLFKKISSKYNI